MARSLVTRGVSILALSLGLALPRALRAQSYTEQMQGYMNQYAQQYAFSQGFAAVTAMVTGNLNASANASHPMNLTGGRNYVIIAVCDRDCTDVDLRLYDPMGNNIATDVATDDHPVLRFTAGTSGSYRLQVEMAACSHNPCYYGVQLFTGNGGGVAINPQPMSPQPINQPQPMNMGSGPTQMGTIAFNQQVTGNLTPSDGRLDNKPSQSWGFACQQGQAFQMDILSTWDNYAVVLDPMNNRVAQDDDTGGSLNARITHTCAMTGVYRLVITTYSPSTTTGNYTLQVQQSTPVVLNQPAPLNAPTPMSPTPMAAPTPTPIPMPTRVRTQAQTGNQGVTMPTPSPGSLPITGTIPAPGVVGIVQIGTNVQGRLETGDQRMNDGTFADVWHFQGTAGQHVRVELRSEEFDTYVQLLDAQGNRLAEDDDSLGDLNSMVEINLPATGMYQIVVNNFGEDRRAGIYTLSLR